jgi:hypothetical protein
VALRRSEVNKLRTNGIAQPFNPPPTFFKHLFSLKTTYPQCVVTQTILVVTKFHSSPSYIHQTGTKIQILEEHVTCVYTAWV